jgi:hypothetical protein
MDKALLQSDACYNIPNIRVSGHVCKTNIPSNTAFRGFGGPQAMFIAETWIDQIASTLGIPSDQVSDYKLKSVYILIFSFTSKTGYYEPLWPSSVTINERFFETTTCKNRLKYIYFD